MNSRANISKVLMTTDTAGGVWTFAVELSRELARRGVQVVLAALGGTPSEAQYAQTLAIPNVTLAVSNYKLEWMEDPWDDIEASGIWLRALEREHAPDLVHLNSFAQASLGWNSPVVLTAHSDVLSWWQAVHGTAAPDSWARYRRLVKDALHAGHLITVPSAAMAGDLVLHYGIDPSTCRVIPNGLSPADFHLSAKEPFVFTAGRLWDEGKNVRAVAEVAAKIPWPVYLAGDCGTTPVAPCHSLGRLAAAEIRHWYAKAAIYALPARYEPFGLSILEAALSRCALVIGDLPSLHDIWGDAALYVPPDDHESLANHLRVLIADQDLRRGLAADAHTRALTFSSEKTAMAYLDAYQEAATRRSAACVS